LPLSLPLPSCCESFFRRLEEEEEEEEETTVFDEYNTVSCRQITTRLSSCFLPCEKHVPARFRQPTNIKFRLEIHVWESQPLRGSMIGAVVCGPSLSMIGVVSFAAGNQYLIARF
jgi:hypothetical protein